ncbi:16S rRNA (cytidine(1402)-2'-O)-methyltransferase [Pseudofrankia sp. BMG5.37]|uniref:16S rRNA (cytidine(1402)-2'-O)-methyltransferase n=1 Tax=Pseudofrankia sp. BMG5.37 TaxID=3050035 RepID=UPI0028957CCE|nr:16S rRNA (cytidine(1402)-2'-O)-methyltransferase [Pseudofrankia sp. BMG5.37]MDT3441357.1 16S rRNA (cytidine(1402)-2'-O)-methyltransferase [Pseudofrankia sp. BMG5.37]
MTGLLIVCGAPIGDPRDASPRLAEVLTTADVVAAEDTRRVRRLAHALDVTITGRVISCYDAVEGARAAALTEQLLAGRTVALITDAGMPAVSDPGFRVVAAAAAAGVAVTVVPGPSAVTAALAVSGLPSDRFTFEGFLPRRGGERRSRLRELGAERRTMVFLEAPHRLASSLADLAAVFGADRPAVLCRELTKTWEEVVRGDLGRLVGWTTDGREIRGELTLVIGGAPAGPRRPTATALTGAATPAAPAGAAGGAATTDANGRGTDGTRDRSVVGGPAVDDEDAVDDEEPLGPPAPPTPAELAEAVAGHEAAGLSRADARRAVMVAYGVSRADVYAALLAARPKNSASGSS